MMSREQQTPDLRGEMRDDHEAIYLMDHPDSDEESPPSICLPAFQARTAVVSGSRRICAR
jgi:hypothetical protein